MRASYDDLSIRWRHALKGVTARAEHAPAWVWCAMPAQNRRDVSAAPSGASRWPPTDPLRTLDYLNMVLGTAGTTHGAHHPSALSAFLFAWSHAAHHQRRCVVGEPDRFLPLRTFLKRRADLIADADWKWVYNPETHAAQKASAVTHREPSTKFKTRVLRQWRRELNETLHLCAQMPPALTVLLSPRLDASSAAFSSTHRYLAQAKATVRIAASHPRAVQLVGDLRTPVQGVVLSENEDDEKPTDNLTVWQRGKEMLFQHLALTERCAALIVLPPNLHALTHLLLALDAARRGERALPPVVLVGRDYWADLPAALVPFWGEHAAQTLIDLGVTITDDMATTDLDLDDARHWTPSVKTTFAQGDDLIAQPKSRMLTPTGPRLAQWMHGEARPPHTFVRTLPAENAPGAPAHRPRLSRRGETAVQTRGVPEAALNHLLSQFDKREIEMYLRAGAGRHAVQFLYYGAPYSAYGAVLDAGRAILARWDERAEAAFERLNVLARSSHLKNPDALKSWFVGMGTRDVAAEGFATMLNDAVDLVEAGHVIWVERSPDGLGDIIDESAKVAYQHKRVAGKTLTTHIKKAAHQLLGDARTPGAPPGYVGVAHVDVRQNRVYNRLDVPALGRIVAEVAEPNRRLDELQLLLDDRLLRYNGDYVLAEVVPYRAGGAEVRGTRHKGAQ